MIKPYAISIIVPTGNRQDVIEDCLKSVSWADELIVVDSFSTDDTLAIAEQYADRILQHEYIDSAQQKNWAIPQASHEWIMIVDTDERIPDALRQEIHQVLSADQPYVGYQIPRLNYILGQPLRHANYYPDYQIRLFKRDYAHYEQRRVHAHIHLDGLCGTCQAPIIHYAHRSVDQTLRNLLILMTSWEADQRIHDAQKGGGNATSQLWINLLLRPLAAFWLRYVKQSGWRDGYHGLIVSILWAMYVAITYMKIWEQSLDLPDNWWRDSWQTIQPEEYVQP